MAPAKSSIRPTEAITAAITAAIMIASSSTMPTAVMIESSTSSSAVRVSRAIHACGSASSSSMASGDLSVQRAASANTASSRSCQRAFSAAPTKLAAKLLLASA